jgi:peptidoglycan hydrolase-like protein with peptidoglycan-binding domain
VKKVQEALGIKPSDGTFGPITDKAVKDFQKKNKLTTNGIVDIITYKKILGA